MWLGNQSVGMLPATDLCLNSSHGRASKRRARGGERRGAGPPCGSGQTQRPDEADSGVVGASGDERQGRQGCHWPYLRQYAVPAGHQHQHRQGQRCDRPAAAAAGCQGEGGIHYTCRVYIYIYLFQLLCRVQDRLWRDWTADKFCRPRSAGLQQYLGALNRVERALTDLNATNLRSNQKAVSEFSGLLSTGSSKLQDHYRSALRESIQTIEPLHYLTKRKYHAVY